MPIHSDIKAGIRGYKHTLLIESIDLDSMTITCSYFQDSIGTAEGSGTYSLTAEDAMGKYYTFMPDQVNEVEFGFNLMGGVYIMPSVWHRDYMEREVQ